MNLSSGEVDQISEGYQEEAADPNLILSSKKDNRWIWIVKDAKNDKELYLETWDETGYLETLKLNDISMVYNDTVFGGVKWSQDG